MIERPWRIWLEALFISAIVLILDRVTKCIAYNILVQDESICIISGIFHITLVFNKGIAFGLFPGQGLLFAVMAFFAAAFIAFFIWKNANSGRVIICALSLILGGALGNLIDRLTTGFVIDFIDFRIWPVFNVADSAVTVGTVLLALNILLTKNVKRKA